MPNALQTDRADSATDPLIVRLLNSVTQLDPEQLERLYNAPSDGEISLEELVIQSGLADERQIAEAYAKHYLLPLFDPPLDAPPPVDPCVATILESQWCRDHSIAPLSDDGQTIEVAVSSPDSLLLADEVRLITGRQMRPLFTTLSVIERVLGILYAEGSWAIKACAKKKAAKSSEADASDDSQSQEQDSLGTSEKIHQESSSSQRNDRRSTRFILGLVEQTIQAGASVIHLETSRKKCRVRFRVNGSLTEISPPPTQLIDSVVRRLKVLGKIDVSEKALPQDGAFKIRSGQGRVDVRVNTCPTIDGEKIVMRVSEKNSQPNDLKSLGLDRQQFEALTDAIHSPNGLVLVTGPSGSGKSSTLFSCLHERNDSEIDLCTVENAVDRKLAGINQVQVSPKIGLTFSTALRSILRQDPDVVMVSEIPDKETAEISLTAALSGPLVLASMHTKDAMSSIARLKDMQIEPFLLSNTIRLIVAQRLVRKLCAKCKTPTQLDQATADRYGIDSQQVVFKPIGCNCCNQTGYRGRVAIFEVIRVTSQMAKMIQEGKTVEEIRAIVVANGSKLLKQSALEKVISGDTGLDDALGVCV